MRLFVAIELDESVKTTLSRAQRSIGDHDRMVRWVGRDQMHLTLKFLGEVPDNRVPDITAALERAAVRSAPFTLTTRGGGCFPPRGKVRVVWVGLESTNGLLETCQQAVEEELNEVGFPPEGRPFSPHLTLGRVKDDRSGGAIRNSAETIAVPTVTQDASSLVLMQSTLTPQGARYNKLGVWNLSRAD